MKISEILKENGVGIVNAQNSTKDVGPSTTRKNLKAFNLVEGPSLESTVRAIVADTGNSINMLYDAMDSAAKTFVDNRGDIKGLPIVLGGLKSRWMDKFYVNRLQSELHDLTKFYPKSAANLRRLLMAGLPNYTMVYEVVPFNLMRIGQIENNNDLLKAGMNWNARAERHKEYVQKLKAELVDDPKTPPKPKDKATSVYSTQYSMVELVITDALSKLPKKVAGEIRNAIARSDNKLLALQKELAKRGIDPNSLGK